MSKVLEIILDINYNNNKRKKINCQSIDKFIVKQLIAIQIQITIDLIK
jgi:hypothetical protein